MFEYQRFNHYFAPVARYLEELCVDELAGLGATRVKAAFRGVDFCADRAALYRINYQARFATRVLAPLLTFPCHSTRYLTKSAGNISWEEIIPRGKTFAVHATVSNSAVTHSHYAALCLKDGIADYFNSRFGKRPDVNTDNPDVRIDLHIENNKAVISLDTSGESLHKRGYRGTAGEAPLQETLAAALITVSGWDEARPFCDPLCGSGTILCEALMRYCRVPAQWLRKSFGFQLMPDFDQEVWEKIRNEAAGRIRPLPEGLIQGSDASETAVEIARGNLRLLPGHAAVTLRRMRFQDITEFKNGTIVTNPPYGKRLGTMEQAQTLYRELGDFLKRKCLGTTACILSGDTLLRKSLGLKPSRRQPFTNGAIPCEALIVESYRVQAKTRPDIPQ